MLDQVSQDYEGQVAFLAVGGSGTLEATAQKAVEWMPSGRVLWGLDESQHIWSLFGASGTPTTVMLGPDGEVFGGWSGARGEEAMREQIELLLAGSA